MRVEEFLRESAGGARARRRWSRASCGRPSRTSTSVRPVGGDARGEGRRARRPSRRFMDNCVEAVVAIFAVLKAGAVFSPVNPSTKSEKLAYILNNSRRVGARHPEQPRQRTAAEALADAPSVKLSVAARRLRRSGAPRAPCIRAKHSPQRRSRLSCRDRPRSRHDHLHLGVDRLPERRDDDAPEHRRARRLDHDLSREPRGRRHPRTSCRSPSTTGSTRCSWR